MPPSWRSSGRPTVPDPRPVSGDILIRMTLDAVADAVKEVVVDLARVTWLDAVGVDVRRSAGMPPGGWAAPIG